jgi:hypothetical protein
MTDINVFTHVGRGTGHAHENAGERKRKNLVQSLDHAGILVSLYVFVNAVNTNNLLTSVRLNTGIPIDSTFYFQLSVFSFFVLKTKFGLFEAFSVKSFESLVRRSTLGRIEAVLLSFNNFQMWLPFNLS